MVMTSKNGQPIEEVDAALAQLVAEGWEFVQISTFAQPGFLTNSNILLVVRRLID